MRVRPTRLLPVIMLLLCIPSQARGSEHEPWEAEDIKENFIPTGSREERHDSLYAALYAWYQEDLSGDTIHRCPFFPSCSSFAKQAVERHGFFTGLLLFIDRYFYRENSGAFRLYPFIQVDNILKINDSFYLQ